MKDKWFEEIEASKFGLAERGMLATVYDWNGKCVLTVDAIKDVMGEEWLNIAQNLVRSGKMRMSRTKDKVKLEVILKNAKRRESNKKAQQKKRQKKEHR